MIQESVFVSPGHAAEETLSVFSHRLKGFVCFFNCNLSAPAEPSEDGRQQKERSPLDPAAARTPPSTPIKLEEGMFLECGGQGQAVTTSLVTDTSSV